MLEDMWSHEEVTLPHKPDKELVNPDTSESEASDHNQTDEKLEPGKFCTCSKISTIPIFFYSTWALLAI